MGEKRISNRFNGFLLLLLFLFIIFYTAMDKNRGINSFEKNRTEDHSEKYEITAFHKITLGIPININRESAEGLTAIPGIGKTLAHTIEEERKKRNGFKDIHELKTLPGIGERVFDKIKPYIRI